MRITQILHNKAHCIFEADEMPNWPPDPQGNPIILVDITDKPEACEGWDYNAETGEFTEPIILEPEPLPPPEPTDEELIQAALLLNQQEIRIKQAEQDEVLALLLLGQQGV